MRRHGYERVNPVSERCRRFQFDVFGPQLPFETVVPSREARRIRHG